MLQLVLQFWGSELPVVSNCNILFPSCKLVCTAKRGRENSELKSLLISVFQLLLQTNVRPMFSLKMMSITLLYFGRSVCAGADHLSEKGQIVADSESCAREEGRWCKLVRKWVELLQLMRLCNG